jgi:hypothetical protein
MVTKAGEANGKGSRQAMDLVLLFRKIQNPERLREQLDPFKGS